MVTSPFLGVSSRLGLVLSFLLKLIDLKDHFFFWKQANAPDYHTQPAAGSFSRAINADSDVNHAYDINRYPLRVATRNSLYLFKRAVNLRVNYAGTRLAGRGEGGRDYNADHYTLSFFLASLLSGEVTVFGLAGVAGSVGVVTSATSAGDSSVDSCCFVSSAVASSCCGC